VIVLDTNVLAELMRARPEPDVVGWVAAQPSASLFTTTVTQAEVLYGIAILPSSKRRDTLTVLVEGMFADEFDGRVLPFDASAAREFASIAARRREIGRPISQLDAQIAAIARSRSAAVATRNVRDFEDCGISIADPWNS
jgi:hypothetical protein